jgi:hypothetical protein
MFLSLHGHYVLRPPRKNIVRPEYRGFDPDVVLVQRFPNYYWPHIRQLQYLSASLRYLPTLDQMAPSNPIHKLIMNGLVLDSSARHHIPQLPDLLKPYLIILDDPVGLPVRRACQTALLPKSVLTS